jgi:hypothetical protein
VRELYPSTSKFARRGVQDFNGKARMPEPTRALPGTPEKVAVLEERARLGQCLWHPLDARLEDAPRFAEPDQAVGVLELEECEVA